MYSFIILVNALGIKPCLLTSELGQEQIFIPQDTTAVPVSSPAGGFAVCRRCPWTRTTSTSTSKSIGTPRIEPGQRLRRSLAAPTDMCV